MARTKRSAKLDTRTARLNPSKVKPGKMHQEPLASGQYLAYRRAEKGGAGSWFARWNHEGKIQQSRLGTADDFQDANGEEFLDYSQAQAKAQSWFGDQDKQAKQGDSPLPAEGPLTVILAVTRYIGHKEREGSKSIKDMRLRAKLWIEPVLGAVEVAQLTLKQVKEWHQSIAESERQVRPKLKPEPMTKRPRKKKEGEAKEEPRKAREDETTEDRQRRRKSTANRILTLLKAALTHARTSGWVVCSDDAWTLAKPFRGVEEPRQEYLTPQQQQLLLNSITDPDFKRLVTGALTTGCRYGELAKMKVCDFDPTNSGSILIRAGNAKSGKSRHVILAPEGKAFFQSLTAGRPAGELMFQHEAFNSRDWRKGSKVVREWKTSEQIRPMAEACKAAGLPLMGFHQLRHSYASALVAAGMPLALVAKLTGHSDTRMLERHYAHLAPSDLSRALEAMAPKLNLEMGNVEELAIKRGS